MCWGKRFKHWASIWKTKPDRPSGPSRDMPCWFPISNISLSFYVIFIWWYLAIWFLSHPVFSVSNFADWPLDYDMCTMIPGGHSLIMEHKHMPEALASLPQEHAEELLERLDKTVVLETVLLHCFGGYFWDWCFFFKNHFSPCVAVPFQGTFANIIDS